MTSTTTTTTNKDYVGSIIKNGLLVQGYESIKEGSLSGKHMVGNITSVTVNEILAKPWLKARIPTWFDLKTGTDDEQIDFITNTLGLSASFMITDKISLSGDEYKIQGAFLKGISVSVVGLMLNKLAPPTTTKTA